MKFSRNGGKQEKKKMKKKKEIQKNVCRMFIRFVYSSISVRLTIDFFHNFRLPAF